MRKPGDRPTEAEWDDLRATFLTVVSTHRMGNTSLDELKVRIEAPNLAGRLISAVKWWWRP